MKAPPDGKLQESPLPASVRFWEFWHEQTLEHLINRSPSQVCFVVFETEPRRCLGQLVEGEIMGFVVESGFGDLGAPRPLAAHHLEPAPTLQSCQCLAHEELFSPHTVCPAALYPSPPQESNRNPSLLSLDGAGWKAPQVAARILLLVTGRLSPQLS